MQVLLILMMLVMCVSVKETTVCTAGSNYVEPHAGLCRGYVCKSKCVALNRVERVSGQIIWGCSICNDHSNVFNRSIVAYSSGGLQKSNIAHYFHDQLWALWTHMQYKRQEHLTLLYHPTNVSSWGQTLFYMLSEHYKWNLQIVSRSNTSFYSAIEAYVPGNDRALTFLHDEIPLFKSDVRAAVLSKYSLDTETGSLPYGARPRIVIYSRWDANTRRILQPREISSALFNQVTYEVVLLNHMPSGFEEQIRVFAGTSLVLAPNGGWIANVIFLPVEAVVIELHMYRTDSWLEMFGLNTSLKAVVSVIGHYSSGQNEEVRHPNRRGGDADFAQTAMLISDIRRECSAAPACKRFLS